VPSTVIAQASSKTWTEWFQWMSSLLSRLTVRQKRKGKASEQRGPVEPDDEPITDLKSAIEAIDKAKAIQMDVIDPTPQAIADDWIERLKVKIGEMTHTNETRRKEEEERRRGQDLRHPRPGLPKGR
jgi:hypothetical protein